MLMLHIPSSIEASAGRSCLYVAVRSSSVHCPSQNECRPAEKEDIATSIEFRLKLMSSSKPASSLTHTTTWKTVYRASARKRRFHSPGSRRQQTPRRTAPTGTRLNRSIVPQHLCLQAALMQSCSVSCAGLLEHNSIDKCNYPAVVMQRRASSIVFPIFSEL